MKEKISDHYKFAAKLTFVSAFITLLSFFMDDKIPKSNDAFLSLLLIFVLTIATGVLILKNIKWIRYVLLVSMIISLFKIFLDPTSFFIHKGVMLIIMDVFSIALQIYILLLLFKKPSITKGN